MNATSDMHRVPLLNRRSGIATACAATLCLLIAMASSLAASPPGVAPSGTPMFAPPSGVQRTAYSIERPSRPVLDGRPMAPPFLDLSAWGLAKEGIEPLAARPLRTRYPIVLAHGIMGFRALKVAGINFGNYFRGVEAHLRKLGVTVMVDHVGMTNGVAERAQRLCDQIAAAFPDGKVNIIAHSLGGMDSRWAISRLGLASRVASLTTIGTPHRGTPVADWTVKYIGSDLRVKALLDWAGVPNDAFENLTGAWSDRMNAATPNAPGVRYFSMGGTQVWYDITPPLLPFYLLMKVWARVHAGLEPDPADLALVRRLPAPLGDLIVETTREELAAVRARGVSSADLAAWRDGRGENDGLVPLASTPWGESFQVIDADHFDEIGWLTLHDTPAMYEQIVRGLARMGL